MTILIADNFALVRSSLKRILESLTSVTMVVEASGGYEALELFGQRHPDMLILDVLRELQTKPHQTTLIVLTNVATPQLRQQCLELGVKHV